MIYRSNLTCPDFSPCFRNLDVRPMPHSFGHSVPSDWVDKSPDDPTFGLYKRCGLWTHDEAAILWNVAESLHGGGDWLDIGAHTGWTTIHMTAGAGMVHAMDPMLRLQGFSDRFEENLDSRWSAIADVSWLKSREYFVSVANPWRFDGICIDGDHEPGEPLADAQNAAKRLHHDGVILFHDFIGQPVREAVAWLRTQGFRDRVYFSPHMVAVCWRDESWTPPDHVPDPNLPNLIERCPEFDFSRCV